MQYYMLERLLERISLSRYRDNFVLKGGLLITAMVGLSARSTMDMDTSIDGFSLTYEELLPIFKEICAIRVEDDVHFEVVGASDIRENDDYPGIRVSLRATYDPMVISLTVDVGTGDAITPGKIEYSFPMLFDDRTIDIYSYNLETVLAEKLATALSRGSENTRSRDFYDLYILQKLYGSRYDRAILRLALERTMAKRGKDADLESYPQTIEDIRGNGDMRRRWERYCERYSYARDISFDDTCDSIQTLMESIAS